MEARARTVFDEYAARAEAEGRLTQRLSYADGLARLDEFLLPVGEDTVQLMRLIVKSARARSIPEIDISYDYSTLHFADAAQSVEAKMLTIELSAAKSAHACDSLTRAGPADHVQSAIGVALRILPGNALQFAVGILGDIGADPENLTHLKRVADKLLGANYRWSVLAAGRHQMLLAT